MSCSTVIFSHFLFFIAIIISLNQGSSFVQGETNGATMMVPLIDDPPKMVNWVVMNESNSRRKLNSFRICALCTCCGGPKGLCLPSPCCYAINCNIPNRPFGFCAFTPKSCNCLGCHL